MLEGVQILLDRMDTNPEEFDIDGWLANWSRIYDRYEEFLTKEERKAIEDKRAQTIRDTFTADVMRKVMGAPKRERELSETAIKTLEILKSWGDDDALKLATKNRYNIPEWK